MDVFSTVAAIAAQKRVQTEANQASIELADVQSNAIKINKEQTITAVWQKLMQGQMQNTRDAVR